ncbi:unnamed protein product [Bursaphelenchus xylophilus]|uniref:(pine wood nematode) hypothetical protein n=1 Tax=Bursaphelenchus xylophilus TaxID=6326 RepID=A0A1I7S359_BURXY|nr:unnamed protein product [Bursaphelenchus xylophilus]CAG9116105.1 unnamed protein product [Bursaphelenchus xylophilus]
MPDFAADEPLAKPKDLYEILGVRKEATDEQIKKAYRKLALQYHPDKNRDGDPEKTEKFKEVNHANSILSNPSKRKVYDQYGDMGLKLMDQVGEETMKYALNPWMKWLVLGVAILTCGCGCCCCFCCCFCNFCCGKFRPDRPEGEFDTDSTTPNATSEPVFVQPQRSDEPIVLEMPSAESRTEEKKAPPSPETKKYGTMENTETV